jgi:hypothetical protein
MAKVDIKGKGKQCQQNESDDEVICLDIDDVSTLLKSKEADDTDEPENHSDLITTPDRKPLRTMEELLKTSPPSPLFCERKKGDAPLPKAPVFVIDDSDEEDTKPKKSNKPNKPSVLRDDLDLDLDASVAAIFRPKKGGVKRKKKPDVARVR